MTSRNIARAELAPVVLASDAFGLLDTTIDGKFQLESIVAEGGFGIIYRGTHLTLCKPVAFKVLKTPPEFNDEARADFIEKFAQEARTIAQLEHPNIVRVLDFGSFKLLSGELVAWMALEWLSGTTLEKLLADKRGLGGQTPAEALALLKPVFEAVAFAHAENVVHRDIKPANIMLVDTKRGISPKLMDFGIAKIMTPNEKPGSGVTQTRSTMNAFSPSYAAPEQISATRTGPWTDVHALGLILTEVITGQPAYIATDVHELFEQILQSSQRPTPASKGVDVGCWEAVIQRALSTKPDARYKTAGEFLAALEAEVPSTHTRIIKPVTAQQTVDTIKSGGTSYPDPSFVATIADTSAKQTQDKSKRVLPWVLLIGVVVVVAGVGGYYLRGRSSQVMASTTPSVQTTNHSVQHPSVQGSDQQSQPTVSPSTVNSNDAGTQPPVNTAENTRTAETTQPAEPTPPEVEPRQPPPVTPTVRPAVRQAVPAHPRVVGNRNRRVTHNNSRAVHPRYRPPRRTRRR